MPRFIIKKAIKSSQHDALVAQLADELRKPSDKSLPLILEEEIDLTGSRHVYVIWDLWDGLSEDQRTSVIVDAYEKVEGHDAAEEVTLALGMTPKDALVLGYLPYQVQSGRKRHENRPTAAEHNRVFKGELPRSVLGADASELRFARQEDAEAAVERLSKALPGSKWVIRHDTSWAEN